MKLLFLGANHEVTGSCHYIECGGKKIVIDCGLQQGQDQKDDNALPFNAGLIDYLIITHAHIDHSGRVPLMVKNGFRGQIFATGKTCELLRIMLRDSAFIQENDAQWKARKGKRSGSKPEEPLYTIQDAEEAVRLLVPVRYHDAVSICDGVTARFIDAGHLLGSASVELFLSEDGEERKVVFSGDIGNYDQPIIRDPQYISSADYVVMESTYGDRMHNESDDVVAELAQIIDKTIARGGNVIIPSFAVGRTQELLYFIREMKERHLTPKAGDFTTYVDSPLAAEATRIYDGDLSGYADAETVEILKSGFRPLHSNHLRISQNVEESIALNTDTKPKVIISSSGMCEAGRIRHHLKHNLWRPECSVVFVGYQANGTLGRMLLNGVTDVKLFGEKVAVKAQIHNLIGMSGHADKEGLLNWISSFDAEKPKRVFIVHGENETAEMFKETINAMGFTGIVPNFRMEYDLLDNACTDTGIPYQQMAQRPKQKKGSPAYIRLQLVGEQLQDVIRRNEGLANKELGRFADQLKSLIEKWDR